MVNVLEQATGCAESEESEAKNTIPGNLLATFRSCGKWCVVTTPIQLTAQHGRRSRRLSGNEWMRPEMACGL